MPLVDKLYDWLARTPNADCDRILGAGLEHAEPAFAERIRAILAERDTEASWANLLGDYANLPDALVQTLGQNVERRRAALAQAVRLPSPHQRQNALLAYEDDPTPTLAYVLPGALRDSLSKVRGAAAATLRTVAQALLDRPPRIDAPDAEQNAYSAARRQVVKAVHEGLRTFDLHFRIEVLETALWLCPEVGEPLWELLDNRRSRAGNAVIENLDSWNNPKLAGFLLCALARQNWHRHAARLLRSWSGKAEVCALLALTPLLGETEIRKQVPSMRTRGWLDAAESVVPAMPPALRGFLPRWLLALGYTDQEKVGTLARWSGSRFSELARAATYALADVEHPSAVEVLSEIAQSNTPNASFARWYVEVRQAGLTRPAQNETKSAAREQPSGPAADFASLWQICRRKSPSERVGLIELIRENAALWRGQLVQHIRSPDPRDRAMVLQVLSVTNLARDFAAEIETLLADAVDPIRRLAESLLASLSELPRAALSASGNDETPDLSIDEARAMRRELDELLRRLLTDRADPSDPAVIRRARTLLKRLYGHLLPENFGVAPAGAA